MTSQYVVSEYLNPLQCKIPLSKRKHLNKRRIEPEDLFNDLDFSEPVQPVPEESTPEMTVIQFWKKFAVASQYVRYCAARKLAYCEVLLYYVLFWLLEHSRY